MESEVLMAPKGLKIGDTFDEVDFQKIIRHKIVGIDGQGNYIAECIGEVDEEELPFASTDDDVVVEQPIVEEPKEVKAKATPKKKTTSKKKTTTKKK